MDQFNFSNLDIQKALDTTNTTTGSVLVPEIVSPGIRLFVETRSPLYSMIRKLAWDTQVYAYVEQNGLPVASWGAEMAALPAASQSTYADRFVPLKSLYTRGEISGQLLQFSRTYVDILQREIENHALALARKLEAGIVAGDATANPNEFDGLDKLITNTVNAAGTGGAAVGVAGPLSMALFNQLSVQAIGSTPSAYIMDQNMQLKLWSIFQTNVRYMNEGQLTIQGGTSVPTWGGRPIITLTDVHATLVNKILAPDMSMIYMPVGLPITYEELAKTRDSRDYFMRTYLTLVVEGAARHHAKLINVSSAIA